MTGFPYDPDEPRMGYIGHAPGGEALIMPEERPFRFSAFLYTLDSRYETTGLKGEQIAGWLARREAPVMTWETRVIKRARSATGNVYFVQDEAGAVKIGYASDVNSRVSALQTASSQRLTLLASSPGSLADEAELHRSFAASRIRGEWFEPTGGLLAHIESVIAREQAAA